jgi:hypothetical protein
MPIPTLMAGAYGYGRAAKTTSTVEFNYPNFASTAGLKLLSTEGIIDNALYLTTATNSEVGNGIFI